MIELTGIDLTAKTAVELRKLGAEAGIKGASKGKKADLFAALVEIQYNQDQARMEATKEARKQEEAAARRESNRSHQPKRGICTECGRKEDFAGSGLCRADREYAEWENAHSDNDHEAVKAGDVDADDFGGQDQMDTVLDDIKSCQVCDPSLDRRTALGQGRSRAGMEIVAKGTEIHKSLTFKRAAEAVGWTVEISTETYELGDDATGEGTRHYATAQRGDDAICLVWDGRAYDYPNSSALFGGKVRKVRNLKEALRLI